MCILVELWKHPLVEEREHRRIGQGEGRERGKERDEAGS